MNRLLELQNIFQSHLLNPQLEFKSFIHGTQKISAETRLSIYENAYRARLVDALAASYPILNKYLGDQQFYEMAELYLKTYPSTYRTIRWFGDQLDYFLYHTEPYINMPHLAELAQFEWTLTLVFDALDCPVLDLSDVLAITPESWPNMRFYAHSSLCRLNLKWNVVQIWQALHDNQDPPELLQYQESTRWILWRKELTHQFCSIPEDEAWAIDAILQGVSFSEICDGLCLWVNEENAGLHAASLLKGWIHAGVLSKIEC